MEDIGMRNYEKFIEVRLTPNWIDGGNECRDVYRLSHRRNGWALKHQKLPMLPCQKSKTRTLSVDERKVNEIIKCLETLRLPGIFAGPNDPGCDGERIELTLGSCFGYMKIAWDNCLPEGYEGIGKIVNEIIDIAEDSSDASTGGAAE